MILGSVNVALEPVVSLNVLDAAGQEHTIEALIDPGFSSSLTLPPALLAALGLPRYSQSHLALANGTVSPTELYFVTLIWDGVSRHIFAHAMDGPPLVGTRLLYGHDLRVRFEAGGVVEIEEIP